MNREDADDLAEVIVLQARELFLHLPPAEISDDEKLEFKTDHQGCLMIHAHGATYVLREGLGWRYRPLGGGLAEVASFQNGELAERKTVGVGGGGDLWKSRLN